MSEQGTFRSATLPASAVPAGLAVIFGVLLMLSAQEIWVQPGNTSGLQYRSGEIVRWLGLASVILGTLHAAGLLHRAWFARMVGACGLVGIASGAWVLLLVVGDTNGDSDRLMAADGLRMVLLSSSGIGLGGALAARMQERSVHALSAVVSACAVVVIGSALMPWTSAPYGGDPKLGIEHTRGVVALVLSMNALMAGLLRLRSEIDDKWFGRAAFPAALVTAAATFFVYATEPGSVHYPAGMIDFFTAPRVQAEPGLHVAAMASALMLACSAMAMWPKGGSTLRRRFARPDSGPHAA